MMLYLVISLNHVEVKFSDFFFIFQVPGKVIMGSTIDPLSTLPRANKIDPSVSHTLIFNRLIQSNVKHIYF